MEKEVRQQFLTGERALFAARDLAIYDTIFDDGESPLKESENIALYGSMFKWKYPLWYSKNIQVKDCTWFDMARAGVWYTDNMSVEGAMIEAPKNFRRCKDLSLRDVTFTNAEETLWSCDRVTMYDSFISGEYLGWNAKNLTLVNCTIESLQGMCYIDNLVMKNCKLINTTLAFEYSSVEADIDGTIDSVMNPTSGRITADHIEKLIMEKDKVDTTKTMIVCRQ